MMCFVDVFILYILIISPLLLYLFFVAYNKNINNKVNNLSFSLVLLTMFYLQFKYFENKDCLLTFSVSTIPLIISFIRKDFMSTIVLILLQIFIFNYIYSINLYLLLLQFVIIVIYYLVFKTKYLSIFIFFINFLFIIINNLSNNMLELLFSVLASIIIYNFIIIVMKKGEEILNYHLSLKELEKEKQLRDSLFKISHEIKNPIAVCKGYFDMMDINNEEQVKKYLPIINEEINHTLLLLQDFLSITKIKVDKEYMDVNLLVEDTVESFKPIFKSKKISIESNILDDDVYINGDYNRLKQVLTNILKNSMEAIEEKGKIIVNTSIEKDDFIISISDNGTGMSEEVLKHFMDPFYTTKKNGTGLGVCLSEEILKEHFASIKYNSKENVGTNVLIYIPIKKKNA